MVGGMIVGGTAAGSSYYDKKFPHVGVSRATGNGRPVIPKTKLYLGRSRSATKGIDARPLMIALIGHSVSQQTGLDIYAEASGTASVSMDRSRQVLGGLDFIPLTSLGVGRSLSECRSTDITPKTIQRIGRSIQECKTSDLEAIANGTAIGILGRSLSESAGKDVLIIWKVEGIPDILPMRDGTDIIVEVLNRDEFPNTPVAVLFAEDRFDLLEEIAVTNSIPYTIEDIDPELDHKISGRFKVSGVVEGELETVTGNYSVPKIIIGVNRHLTS